MSTELDLTGLTEKRNRQGTVYYEDADGEMVAKECTKCGTVQSVDGFSKDKSSLGGRKSNCRYCEKKYCQENADRIREQTRNYYQENADRIREYRQENADRIREYCRNYYQENRDLFRMKVQRRRARKALLPDTLTADQQAVILEHFNGGCALTGSSEFDWEHAIPISIGRGGTTRENMYPLRSDLNYSKNNRNLFDWFYANKERYSLEQTKFDELIEYLAEVNDMTSEEYEAYVRWCHDNPRDLTKVDEVDEIDVDVAT